MSQVSDARDLGQEATASMDALVEIGRAFHQCKTTQGQAAMLALKEALKLKHIQDRAEGMELHGWSVIWRL